MNNITSAEIAEAVEATIQNEVGFQMDAARIYGVTMNGTEPEVGAFAESQDIYDLLESGDAELIAIVSDFVAVATSGWAAPVEDDGVAPSQHPERRRVRLTIIANTDGVASVLRFQDDDEVIVDNGNAHGSLAQAVNRLLRV